MGLFDLKMTVGKYYEASCWPCLTKGVVCGGSYWAILAVPDQEDDFGGSDWAILAVPDQGAFVGVLVGLFAYK